MTTFSTRRAFLKSAPAAIVSSAVLPVSAYATSATSVATMTATPALVEAYGRLTAALAEQREANDALEWLADEWRHVWPLAPEELLGGANADRYSSWRDTAERDIIGNFLSRDTGALTVRLAEKFRRENPRTCFSILTSEEAQETINAWLKSEPTGRTEKALARNRARRQEVIQEYSHKVTLARQYEAETERLRHAAGVSKVRERILQAERQVSLACSEISNIPATNLMDLAIKGEVIMSDDLAQNCKKHNGILGEMARFIQEAVVLSGGASS